MKTSKNITKVISSFLFYSTFALIFVEIIVMFIYFFVSSYFTNNIIDKLETKMYNEIISDAEYASEEINLKLESVARSVKLLEREHENFFENISLFNRDQIKVDFEINEDGMFYKSVNNNGSSLLYSSDTIIDEYAYNKAVLTEVMDQSFRSIVGNDSLIVQAYFNAFDNMIRIYPYMDKYESRFKSNFNLDNFNFYNLASEANNPDREYVWTSAYLDPAGEGWMISCIVPIYNGDKLEGVSGVDITLEKLINKILNIDLHFKSGVLIVDEYGIIIAMDQISEDLIGIDELNSYVNSDEINATILKPKEYNIFNNPDNENTQILSELLNSESESLAIFDGIEYNAVVRTIPETNWNLFIFTNVEELTSSVKTLKLDTRKSVMIVTIAIWFVFIFISLIINRLSAKLSSRISEPICELSEQTKILGTKTLDVNKIGTTGIKELDNLSLNFYKMTKDIKQRTDRLVSMQIDKNESDKEIESHIKEATTDVLTQIFNRRKVDDVMKVEIARSNRYKSLFSVILFDIDFFKEINDEFGHSIGDEVLIEIAYVLNNCIRVSDVVARWGGDEFVVIALGNTEQEAYLLGEKIRHTIENHKFPKVNKVTTSVGVAEIEIGKDDQRSLLVKADMSLYEAKNKGKNKIVRYSEIKSSLEIYHEKNK